MKKRLLFLLALPALLLAQEKHMITVMGKKIPFVFDGKRQVIVIEGDVLRQIPALTLPALISAAANMHFTQRGLFQADPQLMGFNQEQLLVLVNGLPANNAQTGHHNFTLPFEVGQVERIEITRSAYSSLTGSAGAAGTVNIITGRRTFIHLSAGSFGTSSASASLKLGNWGIASGIMGTNGYMKGVDGKKIYLSTSGRLALGNGQLDVWAGWTSAAFGAANFYAPYNSCEELDRLLSSAEWNWPISDRIVMEARFSGQFSDDRYTLIRENPGFYSNRHKTWQGSLETEIRRYGDHSSFRLGAAIWSDRIQSRGIRNSAEAPALGDHVRAWYSLLGEWSGESGRFYLNAGLRATGGGVRDLGGHLLLGVLIHTGLTVETSLYRNFRIPTYTELYYSDPMHRSNPQLAPEKTWGFTLGLRRQRPKHQVELRLFVNRSDDLIDWVGDAVQKVWVAQNIQRGTFYGIDLQQTFWLNRASLTCLYTFQKVKFSTAPATKPLKYRYYFPGHSLSLQFVQEIKHFSLSPGLKAEREETSGKVRIFLNLRAGKTMGPFFVYLDGLNLLNTRLEKIPGLPEPPRIFALGLAFNPS